MIKRVTTAGKIGAAGIIAALMGMAISLGISQAEASPTTIYVPDNYATIQEAVDAATTGDAIVVRDGTYTENVAVNKDHLTIKSENGTEATIVQAATPREPVFEIIADYVSIIGFTVEEAMYAVNRGGIYLYNANHCNIINNKVSSNENGIYLSRSNSNRIESNIVDLNRHQGIELSFSSNNVIKNNTVLNNNAGIRLEVSGNNILIENNIRINLFFGIVLNSLSSSDASSNNMIMNNNVENNGHWSYTGGIILASDCKNNTIGKNNVKNNHRYGIYLPSRANNVIYLNNFMNNTDNVYSYGSTNIWNTPEEISYTYKGEIYTNYLGNYWSDYAGSDADSNGIGETPYSINSDNDNYPLMEPVENYGMFILVSPLNGFHITSHPTFEWTPTPDALYYQLVIAQDSTFSDIIWNQPSIPGHQTSIPYNGSTLLETDQIYYWKMRYQDGDLNWKDWTAAWSFTKDAGGSPLAAPDLNMPGDGSSVALPETFSWEAISGAERYLLQIASDTSFSSVLWQGQSNVTQITVPGGISGISDGSTYYWHTAGIDTGRNVGDFSDAYSFTKVASVSPPLAPTLVQPAEGDTVRSQTVTFSWSSSGATSYTLRYSVAPGFPSASDSTWTVRGITDTTYSVHLLPATTTIYWKMTASNSAGTSGWSPDRSFYYDVPPSEQVTSAVIDLPRHGIHVPVGANVGGHAYFTGSYNGTISGAWYVNGVSFSSFTAEMTPSEGAEIEISGLPTDIAGEDTLQVCVVSPNSVYSNTVVYTVYVPEVSNAAQLQLRANPPAIPADGDSSCTITAVVQDSAGHSVESDNGREITFSVSGEGTLPSPPTATTVNGIATITLTSTTTPDDSVMVTATASGLASDRVRVFCYDAEYKTYRQRVLAYADRLEHLKLDIYDPPFDISVPSYDVQGVRDFVATRIDTGIPAAEDVESLKRLTLALKVLNYGYHYEYGQFFQEDAEVVEGAEVLWNDFAGGASEVSILAITYPFLLKDLFTRVASELPGWLASPIKVTFQKAMEFAINFPFELLNKVVEESGIGTAAELMGAYIMIAQSGAQNALLEGNFDPVSVLIEPIARSIATEALSWVFVPRYVEATQTSLNIAVACANHHIYSGTFSEAEYQVAIVLSGIRALSGVVHQYVEENSQRTETASALRNLLLMKGNIQKEDLKDAIKYLLWSLADILNVRRWISNWESLTLAYITATDIPYKVSKGIQLAFGQPTAKPVLTVNKVAKPLLDRPNIRLYKTLIREMEASTDDYEERVRSVISALGCDDSTSVRETLPDLMTSGDILSSSMEIARSAIGAASESGYRTVSGFADIYDTTRTLSSNASTERTAFLLSLAQYLADLRDMMSKTSAVDQGYAVLEANTTASEQITKGVTNLFTTPASPLVLVKSYSVPDSMTVGNTVTIAATLMNTGSGIAHEVYVKLDHEDSFSNVTGDSVYIGDLASGSEFDVNWQLIPTEAVVDTSDTLGHAWSIMRIAPYTSDGLSQSKLFIANVYQEVIYGDVSGNGAVTAFDAALILQETVGIITLPDPRWPAFTLEVADVSGDTTISAWDASLVLKYVVRLIERFPVEEGGLPKLVSGSRRVYLGSAEALSDGSFVIPVLVDEMEGIVSGQMEITFDPGALRASEVKPSSLIRDYLFARNIEEGKVRLSFAGTQSKQGGGQILEITFETIGEAHRTSAIELRKVQFNEGSVAVRMASFIYGLPRTYELAQSYPNPFNLTMTIKFQLPEDAHVVLRIYNILGQEVRTLMDKPMGAGHQRVLWDGRDNSGDEVDAGIYIYQLIAGDFVAMKKAVLLK